MHACMHACMHAHMNAWMDGWMDGWIDGCTDGRNDVRACMHARMDVCTLCTYIHILTQKYKASMSKYVFPTCSYVGTCATNCINSSRIYLHLVIPYTQKYPIGHHVMVFY